MTSPSPLPTGSVTYSAVLAVTTGPVSTTTAVGTAPTPASAEGAAVLPVGALLLAGALSGAVIAAAVTGGVNYFLARRASRLEERARVRTSLAEAYQAYADYKEFPYAIRRRNRDDPAGERTRLAEEIRQVQSRLSFYVAWTQVEGQQIGTEYSELVKQLRKVAGQSMHEAWDDTNQIDDKGMNIGADKVDLERLKPFEDTFLNAAKKHIASIAKP